MKSPISTFFTSNKYLIIPGQNTINRTTTTTTTKSTKQGVGKYIRENK
jgi:hypothetical protein